LDKRFITLYGLGAGGGAAARIGEPQRGWLPVLEPMAQKYRLLVPDQIGFGRSDKPLLDYSIQTYVDFSE